MREYKDLNDYEIVYMINEQDETATNVLFDKYKPIILNLAKKYKDLSGNCGLELDDFIQEGNYGLFYAIKKYDDKKDSIFYTYAILCIRSKMRNLITKNSSNKNKALNESISIYKEIGNDSMLLDLLEDKNSMLPENEFDANCIYNEVKSAIYELPFEYSLVMELKMNGFSINDIAKLLGKSKDNVNRIVRSLRVKLRKLH